MVRKRVRRWVFAAAAMTLLTAGAGAQWASQDIVLHPGWNSIYLEVQPEPRSCDQVFAGLPIRSVWAWNPRFTTVKYVRDPNKLIPDQPEWLTYFPSTSREHFLSTLFAVHGGHCYLVEVGGNRDVTLRLRGELQVRPIKWMTNSFNLVGFHVDPAAPPSFSYFFQGSSAHRNQPIYEITRAGEWRLVTNPSGTQVKRGEAYWVYCDGASAYQGPVELELEAGYGLDYGKIVHEQKVVLKNHTGQARQVTLKLDPAAETGPPTEDGKPLTSGDVALSYYQIDIPNRFVGWKALDGPLTISVGPNGEETVRLAVRRAAMGDPADEAIPFAGVLDISDNSGGKFRVPVTALKAASDVGLWVGTVVVNAVSEAANSADPVTPTPTFSEFQFRVIIHRSDANPPVHTFLQNVTILEIQPTFIEDPDNPGQDIIDTPARFVVLSNDDLVANFAAAASDSEGNIVGRRITAPAFGFRTPIVMTGGTFDSMLRVVTTMAYDDGLNPFVHKFHPDHDNLDARFLNALGPGIESYTFTRDIKFTFTDTDPEGLDLPNYGDDVLGGIYEEKISGVHRRDLYVKGIFRLQRVSNVAVLNDGL